MIGAGGGMGIHAVQAACGARVLAAIRSPHRAQAVKDAGADLVLTTPTADLAAEIKRLNEGWGVDAVLDFVANRETLAASIAALAPSGRLVIMGYFPRGGVLETLTWPFTEEIEVTGNRSAGRQDIAQAVALIESGRITPAIGKTYRLEGAVETHRAFEAGEIVGRAVLVV